MPAALARLLPGAGQGTSRRRARTDAPVMRSGSLDLMSWQGPPRPFDLDSVPEPATAYVAAGGPQEATAERGGLAGLLPMG